MGKHADRPDPTTVRPGWSELAVLAVMAVGPTVAAWVYFVALDGRQSAGAAYLASKAVQFALPLWLWSRARPRPPRPASSRSAALLHGALWGLALALGASAIPPLLAAAGLEQSVTARIAAKLDGFGVAAPAGFLALGLAISLVHSALEEYYWRWSVYGTLRSRLGDRRAAWLASAAFASHHVVVLGQFLRGGGRVAWVLLPLGALTVLAAGLLWCRLYRVTGRLTASWISHVAVDLALFGVGAWLLWG
jgi:uncharacterized protein